MRQLTLRQKIGATALVAATLAFGCVDERRCLSKLKETAKCRDEYGAVLFEDAQKKVISISWKEGPVCSGSAIMTVDKKNDETFKVRFFDGKSGVELATAQIPECKKNGK